MIARRLQSLATAAVAVAAMLTGHGAHAQSAPSAADVDEAKKHYARGVQLYNQKADAAALAELERAYALAPNWKVLYNLGLVELQMNDFASALRSFEKYRAEGGQGLGAAREKEVAGRIALLRDQVATIDVKVNANDAEVILDDVAVGRAPLGTPLIVNPGHHKLGASKAGRSAEAKAVSVAGADHVVVELAIDDPPPAPPIESTPTAAAPVPEASRVPVTPVPLDVRPLPIEAPKETPAHGDGTAIAIAWSATGALAAGAIVTGLIALSANTDLSNTKAERPTSIDDLNHLASRAHGFAVASDVLTLGAVAAAGASLYLTLRAARIGAPAAAATGSRGASIDIALGPANVRLVGAF